MPNITFDKKYLHKLIGFKIEDKKLVEEITKMGPDVEEENKESITVEVDANRPDLFDAVGFARALRNFMHKSKKFDYKVEKSSGIELHVGKAIEGIRPYISALVVKNLKLSDDSLKHMIAFTEKFCETFGRNRARIAIGMHDLSKVNPPLYYDAFIDESFVPLGGSSKMSFSEILNKNDKGIMYASTLGNAKAYPAIKDTSGIMAFIPIINSERTRVTPSTTSLFVDITGTQEYAVKKSADLLACMFIDIGADVEKVKILRADGTIATSPTMEVKKIDITLSDIELNIGVVVGFNNTISLANKMGYKASFANKRITFYVPPYRLDVMNEQDIIEDVAIAYGYDYIQPIPVYSASQGILDEITQIERRISYIMIGMGFSEESNFYLTNEKQNFTLMNITENNDYIKVKNAKTSSITMLRTSLLPSLLNNIGQSTHEKMPQRIYEFDMVFTIQSGRPVEHYNLGILATDPKANFNYIKSVVDAVLYNLYGEGYKVEEASHKSFIEGRCAKVILKGKEIGIFGEIHPSVLSNFGIEEPSFGAELTIV